MKQIILRWSIIFVFLLLASCATTAPQFVPAEPEEGKSIVVGGIILENQGIDNKYEMLTSYVTAIVVGKSVQGEEEVVTGYRVVTDDKGYFAIQNVPPGSYVLKGIEGYVGKSSKVLISSEWLRNKQAYYLEEIMIDNVVRYWPPENLNKVIDLGIYYFLVNDIGNVAFQKFLTIENQPLGWSKRIFNMSAPNEYFRRSYMESRWFD